MRSVPTRSLGLVVVLVAACSGGRATEVAVAPSAPPLVPTTASAPSATTPSARGSDAIEASAPAPSASPPSASASALAPVAEACHATSDRPLDLSAVFDGKACDLPDERARARPVLAASIHARLEPAELTLARGDWVVLQVHLVNDDDRPTELVLERAGSGLEGVFGSLDLGDGPSEGGHLGHSHHGKGGGREKPAPARASKPRPATKATRGFDAEDVRDARGRSMTFPPGMMGMLGALGPARDGQVRLVLDAHAEAVATVVWSPRGYDQDRPPLTGTAVAGGRAEIATLTSPEALGPGKYTFAVTIPCDDGHGDRPRLSAKLTVAR